MKVVIGTCMILGCFFGAGFVSGREISFYFARFGSNSILAIISATILFFLLTMFFFLLSNKMKNFSEFSDMCFGKYASAINILLSLCMLIISGSMLSGTRALACELRVNEVVLLSITIVITFCVIKGNTKSVSNINMVLVPILVAILLISSFNVGDNGYNDSNRIVAILNGAGYVFINIVSLGMFILEIGHKYTMKQKAQISLMSSLVIAIILIFLCSSIISNNIVDEMMPNLILSSINPALYVGMQISIYFGLLTTYIANIFVLCNYVIKFVKKRNYAIILTVTTSAIISMLKFDIIVGYVYWIICFVGIIIVVGSCIHIKKERRSHLS